MTNNPIPTNTPNKPIPTKNPSKPIPTKNPSKPIPTKNPSPIPEVIPATATPAEVKDPAPNVPRFPLPFQFNPNQASNAQHRRRMCDQTQKLSPQL